MRKSEKPVSRDAVLKFSDHKPKRADELETDLDALFRLPLAEFTGSRNALAARLKKSGRGDEAVAVKGLAKPSISAWAVNQLYWDHREAFDQLIASGERFHKAQASRGGGKVADMRAALDARREALLKLSDMAARVLREAGHNPAPDTIHRITTTLEGISAYAQHSDGPVAGRLTHDVDPPGFESFGSFVPAATKAAGGARQPAGGKKQAAETAKDDKRQVEEARKSKLAGARASLQDAKRMLAKARARAESLQAAQKKADAEAKKAAENLRKAKVAAEDAARRAQSAAEEVEEAASAVDDAERAVEEASEEVEKLSLM